MTAFHKAKVAAMLTYGLFFGIMVIVGWPRAEVAFFLGWLIPWTWLCLGPHLFEGRR
jgi:hypothetical protein